MTKTVQHFIGVNRWWLVFWLISQVVNATSASASAEYEYIVIGSGPGGGPLAANLARQGHSVLVLEAGEDNVEDPLQVIPSMANPSSEDPTMSWEFFVDRYADPEQAQRDSKYTWELKNGSFYVGRDPPEDAKPLGMFYPRVGTLGGCGNHNALGFTLPPDHDWDEIADLTGDDSWRAVNIRQYFERLEKCHYLPNGDEGHGFSGWLGTNRNDLSLLEPDYGFLDLIGAGMTVTGDAHNPNKAQVMELLQRDFNRADPKRYENDQLFLIPLHEDARKRRSSAGTYLKDTVNTLNADGTQKYPLTISTSSLATKLLFSNSTNSNQRQVDGVEYLYGAALYKADRRFDGTQVGVVKRAYATREVIVAGGAFNTPQILKLSGIGPKEELEGFDIPLQVDLPAVGTNLQDNYETGVEALASAEFFNTFKNCTMLAPGDPCLRQFENGTGPYTQGPRVGLLTRSSQSETKDGDLFFFGSGGGGVFRGFYPGYSRASAPANLFWWSIVKLQPRNRAGTVKLRSNDPQDVPAINFNYFKEGGESELTALAEGVELARRIFNSTSEPWSPFKNTVPGGDVKQDIMDESWGHHASCSCSMGTDNRTSCVDSRFKVHGVANLRIVDGSVFPRIPGGFPIAPTFMISEKATDVILEDTR